MSVEDLLAKPAANAYVELHGLIDTVRDHLKDTGGALNRAVVNTEYMLAVGQTPLELTSAVWLAGACALPLSAAEQWRVEITRTRHPQFRHDRRT